MEGKCSSSRRGFVERRLNPRAQFAESAALLAHGFRSPENSRFQFKAYARIRKIGRPSLLS